MRYFNIVKWERTAFIYVLVDSCIVKTLGVFWYSCVLFNSHFYAFVD